MEATVDHATAPTRLWIVASSSGLALGVPAGIALGAPLEVIVGAMIVTPLMLGLSGLFLGASQWLALRSTLDRARHWVALTVLGLAVGFTVALVSVEQGGAWLVGAPVRMSTVGNWGLIASVSVLGVLGGGILGVVQSFALRSYEGVAGRWVLASAAGLATGFIAGVVAALAVGGITTGPGLIVFLVVSALVYSTSTGRVLRELPLTA